MPITVEWANAEKTVARWIIAGDFTGQDAIDAMQVYADLANSIEHAFFMLLDFTAATGNAINALSSFPQISRSLPKKRADAIIVVGNSQTFAMATNIFSRVYGGRFEYFTGMDKAREYLMEALGVHLD
jgi:hypothetical protein